MYVGHPRASRRDRSLDLRLRLVQSDHIVKRVQINPKTRIRTEKDGEQFWGRLALIFSLQRVLNPVYSLPAMSS